MLDDKNNGGLAKFSDLIKNISVLVTPPLLIFVAWLQLSEDLRAMSRWESPGFKRVVEELVRVELNSRNLATKDDIDRLEGQVLELSDRIKPITRGLIKKGIIE